MSYVLIENLTDTYIESLISRNGFTNVTVDGGNFLYSIQDLDGNVTNFQDMDSARRWLINNYVLIQNS